MSEVQEEERPITPVSNISSSSIQPVRATPPPSPAPDDVPYCTWFKKVMCNWFKKVMCNWFKKVMCNWFKMIMCNWFKKVMCTWFKKVMCT